MLLRLLNGVRIFLARSYQFIVYLSIPEEDNLFLEVADVVENISVLEL